MQEKVCENAAPVKGVVGDDVNSSSDSSAMDLRKMQRSRKIE